eukprot:Awhi_evm1s12744
MVQIDTPLTSALDSSFEPPGLEFANRRTNLQDRRLQNVYSDNKRRMRSHQRPLNDSKPIEGFFFSSDTDCTDSEQQQQQQQNRHSSASLQLRRPLSSGRLNLGSPSEFEMHKKQSNRLSFGIIGRERKDSGNINVVFSTSDSDCTLASKDNIRPRKGKKKNGFGTLKRNRPNSDLYFHSDYFSQTESDSDGLYNRSTHSDSGLKPPVSIIKQKSQPVLSNHRELDCSSSIDSLTMIPSPRSSIDEPITVLAVNPRSRKKSLVNFNVTEITLPCHDKRCLGTFLTREGNAEAVSPSKATPEISWGVVTLSTDQSTPSVAVEYTHFFTKFLSITDSLPMKMSTIEKDKKTNNSIPDSPIRARTPSPDVLANLRGRQDRISYYMDSDESDYYSDSDSCSDSEDENCNYFGIEKKKQAKQVERELRLLKQRIKDSQKQQTKVHFATNVFSTEFYHAEVYDRTGFPQQTIISPKSKKKVSEELYFLNQDLFSKGDWYPVKEEGTPQ